MRRMNRKTMTPAPSSGASASHKRPLAKHNARRRTEDPRPFAESSPHTARGTQAPPAHPGKERTVASPRRESSRAPQPADDAFAPHPAQLAVPEIQPKTQKTGAGLALGARKSTQLDPRHPSARQLAADSSCLLGLT
ncbi:hypothetical protein AURDEDRAFT_126616 [Auricularia subglabra TFB-10046 SS5]|nr:hypothetical protein AURDEDRAFT_126616 [Auricularia subglabra TFB-10046 SS5]